LKKAQDTRLTNMQKGLETEKGVERRFQKQKLELVELMEGVHLNNARIEALVEQLNELNRKLVSLEGNILRYALKSKVKREEFLQEHYGQELDPKWMKRVAKLTTKGWKEFGARYNDEVESLRAQIAA